MKTCAVVFTLTIFEIDYIKFEESFVHYYGVDISPAIVYIIFLTVTIMAAATTLSTLMSVSAGSVAANANAALISPTTNVMQTPSEPIFLQTKLAQGIAGTFVFAALFLTCQQVNK